MVKFTLNLSNEYRWSVLYVNIFEVFRSKRFLFGKVFVFLHRLCPRFCGRAGTLHIGKATLYALFLVT